MLDPLTVLLYVERFVTGHRHLKESRYEPKGNVFVEVLSQSPLKEQVIIAYERLPLPCKTFLIHVEASESHPRPHSCSHFIRKSTRPADAHHRCTDSFR